MSENTENNIEKNISSYLPAWEIDRDTITHLVIPEGVTKIGSRAFDCAEILPH